MTYLKGSLNLGVSGNTSVESFMSDETVMSAVTNTLAELAGVPGSRVVILDVRLVPARRLQATGEAFIIVIDYALVVDAAEGSALALESAIASVNTTHFTASLNDELAKASATNIEVTVESIAPPTLMPYEDSTTTLSTTWETGTTLSSTSATVVIEPVPSVLPVLESAESPAMGNASIAVAVAIAVAALATFGGFCACSRQRRGQRKHNASKIRQTPHYHEEPFVEPFEIENSLDNVSVELELHFPQPHNSNVHRGARSYLRDTSLPPVGDVSPLAASWGMSLSPRAGACVQL
jgi:hypothetical protein